MKNRDSIHNDKNQNKVLKLIINNTSDAIIILNSDWNFIFINKSAQEFIKKDTNALLNKSIFKEFPTFKNSIFYQKSKEALEKNKKISFETYYELHNRTYSVKINPEQSYLVYIFKDITSTNNMKELIADYKQRLKLAQKVGHIGTFELNLQTDEIIFSNEFKSIYGIETISNTMSFKRFLKCMFAVDRNVFTKKIEDAIKKKKNLEIEHQIIKDERRFRWIHTQGKLIYDDEDQPESIVGISIDITERKQLESSLKFLSETSKILGKSLDYKTTLTTITKLAVPHIADWCAIDIKTSEGITNLAVAHVNKNKIKHARALRHKYPPDTQSLYGIAKVMNTGQSEFYPIISHNLLKATAINEEHFELMQQLGFVSVMIVPLKSQNKTIGTITLVTSESGRVYTREDLYIAEQIAERASLAIDNSKLYSEMQEQKERLNNLIENVPGIVWEQYGMPNKEEQKIDYVSPYIKEMIGYEMEDWFKPNFWMSIVHPDDKEAAIKRMTDIYKKKKKGVSRDRLITKDGRTIWVETQATTITNKTGKVVGMRGVTMDITDRVELEKRKDEFISMASHELKTPITSLKVYAQLLHNQLKKEGKEHQLNYVTKMENQIDKLTKLIKDLLDLSRIQTGKLTFDMEVFNFNDLVYETIENIQQISYKHKIEIKGKTNKSIYGDKDKISEVIINLLTNAIKYSPLSEKIIVEINDNPKEVKLTVQDFGIGISKKNQKKIFERFYQVNEGDDISYPGLGIGLYISSEIIKRHNGGIGVDSDKGVGSRFWFTLPV